MKCASMTGVHRSPTFQRGTNTNETLSWENTSRQDTILVYQDMYVPNYRCNVVCVWIRSPWGVLAISEYIELISVFMEFFESVTAPAELAPD